MSLEIEIVAIPEGEAPLWVRQSWLGIRMPLLKSGIRKTHTSGVLTGPKTFLKALGAILIKKTSLQEGYLVRSAVAIRELEKHNIKAAEWWRNNTDFHKEGRVFMFQVYACKEVLSDS